ncbi:MAG: type III-A CRISPR-associated RAMP protein Csm4 [Thermodesulfobacteriota bacterium]
MKTYIYRLHFDGPVHFGDTGIGMESSRLTLGSDSLTSAVINAFAVMNEADDAIEALLSKRPGFLLSNLFPFAPSRQSGGITYCLPRPLIPPPLDSPHLARDFGKDIKRITYLNPQGFHDWVGDVPLSGARLIEILEEGKELFPIWDSFKKSGWYAEELRPRVALDRSSGGSALWHCGAVRFRNGAGLYGVARVTDDRWSGRLEAAFRMLGEMGLGGDRTYGMGGFRFSGFEAFEAAMPKLAGIHSTKLTLLSNYFPSTDELEKLRDLLDAWDFCESRGYVVSGRTATKIKRKRVRMVVCGSVAKMPIKGSLVDVTPDQAQTMGIGHRVYRSGLALTIPEGGTP